MGSFDGRLLASTDGARAQSDSYGNNLGEFGGDSKAAPKRTYGRWKPQIPAGATITSAILYLTARAANTSVFYSNIYLISQNSYNCNAFSSSPWAWTNYATPVRFPLSGNLPNWVLDTEYASPDITALVQQWVNSVADPTTAYIGLMVHEGDAGSSELRDPYLYADSSTKCLRLVISWTAGGGPTEKGFADVGGGSDAFINPYRAMPFADAGQGVDAFNTPFRAMGFADVGNGADVFTLLRALGFSDVGHGTEAFAIPFKGLGFSDVGHGSDAFTTPFRAMLWTESGHGVDAFVIPFKALRFTDVAGGTDAFLKEILGAISKAFSETAAGSDSYAIPFKAMRFADVGTGADAFATPFRAMIFTESGHGVDVFIIPFKALGFSDAGHGADIFALLRMLAFSDVGHGTDAFIILLKALGFSDVSHGTDAFIIPYRAMGFADSGQGTDSFLIVFKTVFFSDAGYGSDSFGSYVPGVVVAMKFYLVMGNMVVDLSTGKVGIGIG